VLWISSGMVAYSHFSRAGSLLGATLAQPLGLVRPASGLWAALLQIPSAPSGGSPRACEG
jgi:hypothetical protein